MNGYEIGVKLAMENVGLTKTAMTLIELMMLGPLLGGAGGGAHSMLADEGEGYGIGKGALTGLGASAGLAPGVALQTKLLPKSKNILPGMALGALLGGYGAHRLQD